jgi:hypothetical protein
MALCSAGRRSTSERFRVHSRYNASMCCARRRDPSCAALWSLTSSARRRLLPSRTPSLIALVVPILALVP